MKVDAAAAGYAATQVKIPEKTTNEETSGVIASAGTETSGSVACSSPSVFSDC